MSADTLAKGAAYNEAMRFPALIPSVRTALLLAIGTAPLVLLHAQAAATPDAAPPAQAAPAAQEPSAAPGKANQKIERIHVQDSGATVNELRVGGQTQSISVKPAGRMPEYEVLPNEGGPRHQGGPAEAGTNGNGTRVWNVLKF